MLHLNRDGITLLVFLTFLLLTTACNDNSTDGVDEFNVLETIEQESDLSDLYNYLSEEEWAEILSEETVTLFAPTNEALSEVEIDTLKKDERSNVLQYHTIEEVLNYNDLQETDSLTTFNDRTLTFTTDGDEVMVNEGQATITSNGIEATNGVVFIIDTVLTELEE